MARTTSKDTDSDRELLERLDKNFRNALDHPTWVAYRQDAVDDYRYKEGDQWTAAERRVLESRGQPDSTNNQIKVALDRQLGQFCKTLTRVGYRARNTPGGDQIAAVYSDIFRYIAQTTQLPFEEREVFGHGTTTGFGVFYVGVTFDALFQPDITIRCVPSLECFPDPWSRRYDWNEDAEHISWAKWLSFPEAVELYPAHQDELNTLASDKSFEGQLAGVEGFRNDNYLDLDASGTPVRVRVVEQWYKRRERQELLLFTADDGKPVRLDARKVPKGQRREIERRPDFRAIERVDTTMCQALFSGGILLGHRVDPHRSPLFPFVPYWVERKENGEPYSQIRIARPLQDAINKRESKAIHLVNTNRAIIETNSVVDKTAMAEELAKPDGIVEVRKLEGVRIESNLQLADTQFEMHQQSKQDFRDVMGVNAEALGQRSEVRSGVGIARKQAMTDVILSPVFDNFRRTRILLARVALAMVRQYFTEEKVFYITDDLNKSQAVHFNNQHIQALREGTYDAIVDEMPDTTTLQQEQLQTLGQVIPAVLQYGPAWGEIFFEMSDVRNKEQILKLVRAASQAPPPQPRIALSIQWDALTQEEKVAFAGLMGNQALAQAELQRATKPVSETRQETELRRQQADAATDVHVEGQRGDIALRKEGMRLTADALNQRGGGDQP